MFDVVALKDITIVEMDIHAVDNPQTVEIYTREGTFYGAEQSPEKWVQRGTIEITGMGVGVPTTLSEGSFDPVDIRGGNTMGFYVTLIEPEIRHSEGSGTMGNIFIVLWVIS